MTHVALALRTVLTCSILVASSALTGCAVTTESGEDVGVAAQALEEDNGLAWNGLTMNGLTMNGLTMNGLTMNGLTMNGLTLTSSIASTLNTDANARSYFSYVVSCALPGGHNVTFPMLSGLPNYTFYGAVGIAPEWGVDGGTCDATCQQWVSGCVLARVNALGVHVPLSIRGPNAALTAGSYELGAYGRREATYFGNVLTSPQERYACRAAGDDQTLIGRPCGNGADTSACIINVLDDCATRCTVAGATDGYFGSCATPGDGSFVPAVTVFRQ
jgi:predicted small secreted protein